MEFPNNYSAFNQQIIPPIQPKNNYNHPIIKSQVKLIKWVKLLIVYIIIVLSLMIYFFIKCLCFKSSIDLHQMKIETITQDIGFLQKTYDNLIAENEGLSTNLFGIFSTKYSFENQYTHLRDEYEIETLKKLFRKDVNLKQIYKATIDGMAAEVFHSKCDSHSPSVVLLTTQKGNRFGGFTYRSWAGHDKFKEDADAFLFNFNTRKTYDISIDDSTHAIHVDEKSFPHFGKNDIFINIDFKADTHLSNFPETYGDRNVKESLNKLTNGEISFELKDIQVFHVTFLNEDN